MHCFNKMLAMGLLIIGASFCHADRATFVGTDGNWFNPRNWSTGRIPTVADDVVIPQGRRAVVDPALGRRQVSVNDVLILEDAALVTMPGTIWRSKNEIVYGTLDHRSTDAGGDLIGSLIVYNGLSSVNPTPKSRRDVILKTSVTMGIGGKLAASSRRQGRGTYANFMAERMSIAGSSLKIRLMYGFVPKEGDEFVIIRAGRLDGEFRGLPNGARVMAVNRELELAIHYVTGILGETRAILSCRKTGGDGNP